MCPFRLSVSSTHPCHERAKSLSMGKRSKLRCVPSMMSGVPRQLWRVGRDMNCPMSSSDCVVFSGMSK